MAFEFAVKCGNCDGGVDFPSSPFIPGEKRKKYEVNLLFFSSCMAGGRGKEEMNGLLSLFNHPRIPNRSWEGGAQTWANDVSRLWEKKKEENLVEELELMKKEEGWNHDEQGRVKLEATFDGTWSTRGYSSQLGFATYFGVFSRQPLFTAHRCKVLFSFSFCVSLSHFTLNKICRICQSAERKGKTAPPHLCLGNWSKSSGAMEASIAIEGAKSLAKSIVFEGKEVGVRVGTLIGDGDSKIDTQLKENLSKDLIPDR